MPVVAFDRFVTIAQRAVGGPNDRAWVDLSNALIVSDAQFAVIDPINASDEDFHWIDFSVPLQGAFIAPDAVINSIDINMRTGSTAPNVFNITAEEPQIIPGVDLGVDPNFGISPTTTAFSGNLAYWGLTAQEALDFIRGISGTFSFFSNPTSTVPIGDAAFVYYAEISFDYTPSGKVLAPSVLF